MEQDMVMLALAAAILGAIVASLLVIWLVKRGPEGPVGNPGLDGVPGEPGPTGPPAICMCEFRGTHKDEQKDGEDVLDGQGVEVTFVPGTEPVTLVVAEAEALLNRIFAQPYFDVLLVDRPQENTEVRYQAAVWDALANLRAAYLPLGHPLLGSVGLPYWVVNAPISDMAVTSAFEWIERHRDDAAATLFPQPGSDGDAQQKTDGDPDGWFKEDGWF